MDVYRQALKRRNEIVQELDDIKQFVRLHQRFESGESTLRRGRWAEKVRGRPAEFVEALEAALHEADKPMHRKELVSVLEAKGFDIPGDDKARYLGTVLWRNRDRFANIPEQGYWVIRPSPTEEETGK
jgi:hypothetical protein